MDKDKEWLAGLKVGDEVCVYTDHRVNRIETVTKLTPTQIVVGKTRYRKDTGYVVGYDSWNRSMIERVTDKIRATINRTESLRRLRFIKWEEHSADKLTRILAIVDEPKEADSGNG